MTYSMTGFGQAQATHGAWNVEVEVKTLNHRSLDLRVNMPAIAGSSEILFQRLVKQHMGRGRVEISVNLRHKSASVGDKAFNEQLFNDRVELVHQQLNGAWTKTRCKEFCLSMPDVWTSKLEMVQNNESLMICVLETTQTAVERCNDTRKREGKSLKDFLINAIDELDNSRERAMARAPERLIDYQQRLEERISSLCAELKMPIDERQLAFEIANLADKIDVSEEFARIGAHISALRILILSNEGPVNCVGKKIDFYLQELNREATTIASKSRDSLLTKHTIDMRTQIESMREQAANIQ